MTTSDSSSSTDSSSDSNSADSNEVSPLTSTRLRGFVEASSSPTPASPPPGSASSASPNSSTASAVSSDFLLLLRSLIRLKYSGADARDDVAEGLALKKFYLGRPDEFEDVAEGKDEF